MEKAKNIPTISEAGLIENEFFSTLDKVIFKSPIEIIKTVLKTEGYTVNLENILASLEHLTLGILASSIDNREKDKPIIKKYNQTVQFKLPSKSSRGELLNLFYKEIEIYDSLLSKNGKLANKDENKRKMETLEAENQKLRKEIGTLYKKLGKRGDVSQKDVTKIISNITLQTNNIKQAYVTNISLEKRDIELKIGKKSFYFPLLNSPGLPSIGDECLSFIENGVVQNLFFYQSRPVPFNIIICTVLWKEENSIKVRDHNRKEWSIHAKNPAEMTCMDTLNRGDTVILETVEQTIIRFKKCIRPSGFTIKDELYEELVLIKIADELRRKEEAKGE